MSEKPISTLNPSDDSSEEDEPISLVTTNTNSTQVQNEVSSINHSEDWIKTDLENEEMTEWSQLPPLPPVPMEINDSISENIYEPIEKSIEFHEAYELVKQDKWNTSNWLNFMRLVQELPIQDAREYYEDFFLQFPTAGHWWKIYAEHELREKMYDCVQNIIKKSLMQLKCQDMDLWQFYLAFTKVVKVDPVKSTANKDDINALGNARQLMCDAFELALERVGGSIYSGPLWQSYLSYIQDEARTDPQGFLSVRKLFHRVVCLPFQGMDIVWREYEKFERSIPNNDTLAQSFFKVLRPKFDAAKAVLRDRKRLYEKIQLNELSIPPTISTSQAVVAAQQRILWHKLIAYEKTNPERLEPSKLKSRIRFTFELSISVQRHLPELWYSYAEYENSCGDMEAATAIFERALEALPESLLLSFAFADHYELAGDITKAKNIYEELVKDDKVVSPLVYIIYQRFARRAISAKSARAVFKRARQDEREGACSHHVYSASALLEFYSDNSENGKDVALKIFELGLKKYMGDAAYVGSYLDFLSHLNDDNNMRSLFEKVLAVMPPSNARDIWNRYVRFEHTMVRNGGNLQTILNVEKRRAEAYAVDYEQPTETQNVLIEQTEGLGSILHRYNFLDLVPNSTADQAMMEMYGQLPVTNKSPELVDGVSKDLLLQLEAEMKASNIENSPAAQGNGINSSTNIPPPGAMTLQQGPPPGPPLPDFLKEFASMLPLSQTWNGPVADVEHVYQAMLLIDFPPRARIETMEAQQKELELQKQQIQQQQQIQLQQQQQQQAQQQAQQQQHQNSVASQNTNADEAASVVSKRPTHDIFRSRQQQKLAKLP